MAERDAQSLEIGLGHIGQDIKIDGILGKDGRVLPKPDLIKPSRYPVIDTHYRTRPNTPQAPSRPMLRRRPECGGTGKRTGFAYPSSQLMDSTVHAAAQTHLNGSSIMALANVMSITAGTI